MGGPHESAAVPSAFRRRCDDLSTPAVQDPFTFKLQLSAVGKIKLVILTLTLLPVRLLMLCILCPLMWLLCNIGMIGLSGEQLRCQPLQGWRSILRTLILLAYRLVLFSLGFHWISSRGRLVSPKEAPIIVVGPHTSMFDQLILIGYTKQSLVVQEHALQIPFFGGFCRFMQCISVNYRHPYSWYECRHEIERRAKSNSCWFQSVVCPEEVPTNGSCLISFKTGAFSPGLPVQPVCLTLSKELQSSNLSETHGNLWKTIWLTMCQVHNQAKIEFLPVIELDEIDKENPKEYAEKAKQAIAKCANLPTTDHSREDSRLMITAAENGLPPECGNVEFVKLKSRLKYTVESVHNMLRQFAAISHTEPGYVTRKEFAKHLGLPVRAPVVSLFMSFDKDRNGKIDFREYLIGVALYCKLKDSQNTTEIAFKKICKNGQQYFKEADLALALHSMMPVKEKHVKKVFSLMDNNSDGHISFDKFSTFVEKRPEYICLFKKFLIDPLMIDDEPVLPVAI